MEQIEGLRRGLEQEEGHFPKDLHGSWRSGHGSVFADIKEEGAFSPVTLGKNGFWAQGSLRHR